LPKSRIGVITRTYIQISAINPVGLDGLGLQPTFSTLLDPMPLSQRTFELHSTFHYSYLNIASEDVMLEIQFTHDLNEIYQKKITFAHGSVTSVIEGPSLLVRLLEDHSMDFISYKLEEGDTRQIASRICVRADVFRNRPALVACDATSGRLITCKHCEHMLLQI
jgi:hypothetical protein